MNDIMKVVKPMLAMKAEIADLNSYPYVCSAKLDGCFSGNSTVITNKGLVKIRDIVNKRLNLKALSYNSNTGNLEFKKIIGFFNNGKKNGLYFRNKGVTPDHKFYVDGAWEEYNTVNAITELDNSYAQSVLTGMLLGDSALSIEKRYDGYGMRITWSVSVKDMDYGESKAKMFSAIAPCSCFNRVSGFGSSMKAYTTSTLNSNGFEMWHLHDMDINNPDTFGKRKDVVKQIDLHNFTDLSLAIWYFDDGSLCYNNGNKNTPRIAISVARYSNETLDEFKKLFRDRYAVNPYIARYGKDIKMSFTTSESVYLLYRIARVASGMMPRKLPEDLRFGVVPEPIQPIGLKTTPLQSKKLNSLSFTAYDIEVEGNHNYFCNGALVHNCRAIIRDGVALSRTLKPIPNKYIQNILGRKELHGLDGELIVGKPNAKDVFQKTTSGVMSINGEPDFKYYVFDMWNQAGDYPTRYNTLETLMHEINHPNLAALDYNVVNNLEELITFEETTLDQGYEGIILRMPHPPYKYGRSTLREGSLLKLKRFKDAEALVVDFEELMHNDNEAVVNALGLTERSTHKDNKRGAGVLGAFVCQDIDTGVRFSIGTGFTAEQRKDFWDSRRNLINKIVKYKFFEVGVKKAPRFPVFLGFRNENDL